MAYDLWVQSSSFLCTQNPLLEMGIFHYLIMGLLPNPVERGKAMPRNETWSSWRIFFPALQMGFPLVLQLKGRECIQPHQKLDQRSSLFLLCAPGELAIFSSLTFVSFVR